MRTYVSYFKLRLINGLQYRAAALAGMATQLFWGFILIMVFVAFYSHLSTHPPMSLSQVVTYVWLQQAFFSLIMIWMRDNELFQLITTGNIAYELCRPADLYSFWVAKLLAQRLARAVLRCLPILIIALLLPVPYQLALPADGLALVLFVLAMLLGLLLLVIISIFIYISVFVTLSPTGSLLMFGIIGDFASGTLIPIPLMPSWLQMALYALPFRWTADFPFRVYSGHIGHEEAMVGIVFQIGWIIVLFVIGKWLMGRALRRLVVQGG